MKNPVIMNRIWLDTIYESALKRGIYCSDEFELKIPELSWAELGRLRAKPSLGISIFELKPSWLYVLTIVSDSVK